MTIKCSRPWKNKRDIFQSLEMVFCTQRKRGLTLVEVMLAIVILGIGAGTLMLATARCLAVATKAKHYSNAHRLILRVAAEHPITRGEVDVGTESGSFDDGYTWEREITESEEEDREGLYTVRTRVSWSAHGKNSFEESTTFLYVTPDDDDFSSSQNNAARSAKPKGRTR